MHLAEYKKGYFRGASDKYGQTYTDWRAPYIDRSGLLMIYASDSRPGKYMFFFFTAPASGFAGHYLKTTVGEIETEENDIIKLTTKNSIYRFEPDDSCMFGEELKMLLCDITDEFGASVDIRQIILQEWMSNISDEKKS